MVIRAWNYRGSETPAHGNKLRFEHAPVRKLEQAHAIAVCTRDHRADRCFYPGSYNAILCAGASRCISEYTAEGIAEPAVRLITAFADRFIESHAVPNRFERIAHPVRPAIGLKCHAILL